MALLNVEKARAQYRVARAGLWPQINASASTTRSGDAPATTPSYSLALGLSAFEIDLWGRLRSLSDSAQALVLAQEQAQRSTTLTLVAEVANAWWSLAADQQLLHITHSTLASRAHSLALTEARYQHGAASALEVAQQRSQWQQVRADAAALQGQIEQDMNALQLLVGRPLQKQWLPAPPGAAHEPADAPAWGLDLPALPPGLPAQVLWQRPDIQQAEHQLRAANANIGAARAAFFPTISLTSSLGSASNELSAVLGSGTRTWSFIPNISLPLFDAGRLQGQLEQRQAERDGARVFNKPSALRDHPEKLAIMEFPQFIGPTLVTRDAEDIRRFHAEHQDIILKPLDGMGGMGIFRVGPDGLNLGSITETLNRHGAQSVMVQKFLPEIVDGDKRVLIIGGKPVPFCLARIPQGSEVRGNLAAGGKGVARPLSARDREIGEALGPVLQSRGLLLAGVDVIGDCVTEINVTSPTCFQEIFDQTSCDVAFLFIDALEAAVAGARS